MNDNQETNKQVTETWPEGKQPRKDAFKIKN